MKRRLFSQALIGSLMSKFSMSALAVDNEYPKKPIKIIVGSTPGALTDVATRLYAEQLGKIFKQSVVVENVPGASSIIATKNLLKSAPDGYTLLTVANTVFTLPYLSSKANYSPVKDFKPIAELARGPGMLVVHANSPYKSLKDLVAAASRKPHSVSYASGGIGTTSHLPMEMFQHEANIQLLHVPYKGVAPAVVDLLGGRVDAMMSTPTSVLAALKSGELRALAITSEQRIPEFKNIPTFKEEGFPAATYSIFIALVGPANMPESIRMVIANGVNEAKKNDSILKQLEKLGQGVDSRMNDVKSFEKFLFEDEAKYAKLIQSNHIKID